MRREIEAIPGGPKVIESYPGAAQDVLCIPRKQKGLELLRAGLTELGLKRTYGLKNGISLMKSDAITSAIVGRLATKPMNLNQWEFHPKAQLIIPQITPIADL